MTNREIDALVAEKVFGYTNIQLVENTPHNFFDFCCDGNGTTFIIPHYSTNIAEAWEIVRHMQKDGMCCFYLEFKLEVHDPMWEAGCKLFMGKHDEFITGLGNTPEEAICNCFLKAKGVEVCGE
jgi:hypothetical protein